MADYGKMAYRELGELKQRLERLESLNKANVYNELAYNFSDEIPSTDHIASFQFMVLKNSCINFHLDVDMNNVSGLVSVFVNNIIVNKYKTDGLSTQFAVELSQGLNTIKVAVEYYYEEPMNSIDVKLSGAVSYIELDTQMDCINFTSKSVVGYRNGYSIGIIEYENGALSEKFFLSGKSFGFSTYQGMLGLGIVGQDSRFTLRLLSTEYDLGTSILVDSGLDSIVGGCMADGMLFYGIKGGWVYKYEFDSVLRVVKTKLNYVAKEIYSSSNVENALIIVDFNGNPKLITN